jgi:hypothetical protein
MIVNHHRQFVFIRTPRTGSGSIKTALLKISGSEEIGHHREACTIPDACLGYRVFGLVRNPIDRLHSIWRYTRHVMAMRSPHRQALRDEAQVDFDTWLRTATLSFTGGDNKGTCYETALEIQEIDGGQGSYLLSHPRIRPAIFRFEDFANTLIAIADIIGEELWIEQRKNVAPHEPVPPISASALDRIRAGDPDIIERFYPELLPDISSLLRSA